METVKFLAGFAVGMSGVSMLLMIWCVKTVMRTSDLVERLDEEMNLRKSIDWSHLVRIRELEVKCKHLEEAARCSKQ